jgi:hypothetical protein
MVIQGLPTIRRRHPSDAGVDRVQDSPEGLQDFPIDLARSFNIARRITRKAGIDMSVYME